MPRTIQISLPDGDPRGIRIAGIIGNDVQVIEVPKCLLPRFLEMEESQEIAIYFTTSKSPMHFDVSIGLTRESLVTEYVNHLPRLGQRVLVVTSNAMRISQAHSRYLEWHCYHAIRNAGRYGTLKNNSLDNCPHTTSSIESECVTIFEITSKLLTTLGHPLFISLRCSDGSPFGDEVFYCKELNADGRGVATQEGFVVLAGSTGPIENDRTIRSYWERVREDFVLSGAMKEQEGKFVFPNDYLFQGPVEAVIVLIGCRHRGAGGWSIWKNKEGRTLASFVGREQIEHLS